MEIDNQALGQRLQKMEAAKSHTRKIAYTLFAVALTSLLVAVSGSGL